MTQGTEQYPDPLSLATHVQAARVALLTADVHDQQAMARNLSLALVVVGPSTAEAFLHPACSPEERVCMLAAVQEAVHTPQAFDGAWALNGCGECEP